MSVAAASGAVSTHHHQPTQEQIRLAQLIDDKKHDQPEVQEIVRKVLDVVANSNSEDVLLALFDCDYDYERAVALLIEKGNEVSSEWRTATNHKLTKKQQQQKIATTKNGHGESDENGYQRGHDNSTHRGKTRGGSRSRFQQNGTDSQHTPHNQNQTTNESSQSQARSRGGSAYRGRSRGQNRAGHRPNDRTYSQQLQDANVDSLTLSDTTTQRSADGNGVNRRGRGAAGGNSRQPASEHWDVGNWNGETVIYSRTSREDERQSANSDETSNVLSEVSNGPINGKNQEKSKSDFDPIEAARQIKNVIGIGQAPKPLMDIKPLLTDPKTKSKSSGQPLYNKVNASVSPPSTSVPGRIPHQPVIFSDRFDGGVNKIDVQFGNLGETYEETLPSTLSIPTSTSAFYHPSEPHSNINKQSSISISNENSQRTTEPSTSYISPTMRPTEHPVINQQRLLPSQMQQQTSIAMKPVVTPQYSVQQAAQQQQQQQQHQINTQNILLQSLFYTSSQPQQQQQEVPLESAYDPAAFHLPSIDFSTPFYMATPMNQQAQPTNQARYVVSQPPPPSQPTSSSNRQHSSSNMQTSSIQSTPPSSMSNSSNMTKKGPIYPPGIFPPTAPPNQPIYSATYPATYGLPPNVGAQQQTAGATYSTPYDTDHIFANPFIQLTNAQQGQSPSGAFGSVTPPVPQQQQQQQQGNNSTADNKAMNFRGQFNENLMLLQQYTVQQSNSQQQSQQNAGQSAAQLSYILNRPPSGPSYSPGPPIMYAQPNTAMAQQSHVPKQQGQQYNPNNSSSSLGIADDYYGRSSSSNKESSYMYTMPNQSQHIPSQSNVQQANVSKQHQHQHQHQHHQHQQQQQQQQQQPPQRTNTHVYNNQQRSYQ